MSEPISKVVIVGAGEQAEIAHEYFTRDSSHEVVAFAVEEAFLRDDTVRGLPVVALERVHEVFPPDDYRAFVAISSQQLNRLRERLFKEVKSLGYSCVS